MISSKNRDETATKLSTGRRGSQVVEIAGPAGAGKTTLLRALQQRHPGVVAGVRDSKLHYVPFLIGNTFTLLPTFLRRYRHDRWFTWPETRGMIYVKAWHDRLIRQPSKEHTVTVLDHGPLFHLVSLSEFGPEITKSRVYRQWADRAFRQWAAMLDVVVWLDAPRPVLSDRIHARDRWHVVKGKPEAEVHEFLSRYQRAFEEIFRGLTVHGGPTMLRYDTGQKSTRQIADEVLSMLRPIEGVSRD